MKKFLPFCITTKRGIYRTSLNTSSFLQASRRTSLLQGIERTVSYRFNANNTIECGDGDFYATGTYTLNADGTLYLIEGNDQVDMTIEELTDTTLKASYLDWLEIVDGPPPADATVLLTFTRQ